VSRSRPCGEPRSATEDSPGQCQGQMVCAGEVNAGRGCWASRWR
jgi:hypothetical protein